MVKTLFTKNMSDCLASNILLYRLYLKKIIHWSPVFLLLPNNKTINYNILINLKVGVVILFRCIFFNNNWRNSQDPDGNQNLKCIYIWSVAAKGFINFIQSILAPKILYGRPTCLSVRPLALTPPIIHRLWLESVHAQLELWRRMAE